MKIFITCLFTILSTQTFASLTNESELGILIAKGNSDSQNLNAKEIVGWSLDELNLVKFNGRYLQTKNNNIENARFWSAGFRYDRLLNAMVGIFLGEIVESDIYSGYKQKYYSDLGAKYSFVKSSKLIWDAEIGYRYTIENQLSGIQEKLNYGRGYTEVIKNWTASVSTKFSLEYLPNLTIASDYQMNSELSLSAAINNVFSVKSGYMLRYDNLLNPGASAKTGTLFTTALVAKF